MDEDQPNRSVARLRSIASTVVRLFEADQVILRLYGGWALSNGHQSDAASRALFTSAQAYIFPLPTSAGIVNGRFELATSLLSVPQFELPETYRVRGSVPRIRIRDGATPMHCVGDSESCPAAILKRFTRRPRKLCPMDNCPVTCEQAFLQVEQKMVDTHMASDILFASNSDRYHSIVIISDDTDLVPPLLQAKQSSQVPLALWPIGGTMPVHFLDLLGRAGVTAVEEAVP